MRGCSITTVFYTVWTWFYKVGISTGVPSSCSISSISELLSFRQNILCAVVKRVPLEAGIGVEVDVEEPGISGIFRGRPSSVSSSLLFFLVAGVTLFIKIINQTSWKDIYNINISFYI